jgi:hypothetical protein
MSNSTKSKFSCPECKRPLLQEPTPTGGVYVFCPWGNCPSAVSNDGGEGATELDAFNALEEAVQREEEHGQWRN